MNDAASSRKVQAKTQFNTFLSEQILIRSDTHPPQREIERRRGRAAAHVRIITLSSRSQASPGAGDRV